MTWFDLFLGVFHNLSGIPSFCSYVIMHEKKFANHVIVSSALMLPRCTTISRSPRSRCLYRDPARTETSRHLNLDHEFFQDRIVGVSCNDPVDAGKYRAHALSRRARERFLLIFLGHRFCIHARRDGRDCGNRVLCATSSAGRGFSVCRQPSHTIMPSQSPSASLTYQKSYSIHTQTLPLR